MNNRLIAASTLATAVGLALAVQAPAVRAQGAGNPPQIVKDNMARMAKDKLEKCYGINAAAKNDCAEGAHSCAGQATHSARSEVLRAAARRAIARRSRAASLDLGVTRSSAMTAMAVSRTASDSGESRDRSALPAPSGGAGDQARRSPGWRFIPRITWAAARRRAYLDAIRPRLSDLVARRRAVARQCRGHRRGSSRTHPPGRRADRAGPDVRAHRLEHRRGHLSRRPAAAADDRGVARRGLPACRSVAGLHEAAHFGGKSVHLLCALPIRPSRNGSSWRRWRRGPAAASCAM